jgi:hypothetical protein
MHLADDYIHPYNDAGGRPARCRVRIYLPDDMREAPVVICSKLPKNPGGSITNMAEYLAAEIIEEHVLLTPLVWIGHNPEHEGEIGEYSLVKYSRWEEREVILGGTRRIRVGTPCWSDMTPKEVDRMLEGLEKVTLTR